jgi:iron complex transport system substrate-binding protein
MRIVSLGGSVTEIVYALGAGDAVVGVDASSLYPEAARKLPDVGYFRRVPAEGVLSLEPTVVLASAETGPPETLNQLRSAGVDVYVIPEESSVDGAREKIRAIASVLDRQEAADRLLREMEADLEQARRLRASSDREPRVLFVYARGAGTMQVAGRGTSAEAMIELAGAENAVTGFPGFKPMSAESVAAAEPDVILMLDRGLDSIGGIDGLLDEPGVALTPAGENRRIVAMDDLLMLSFGPRLGEAVKTLTQKLHPNVSSAGVR